MEGGDGGPVTTVTFEEKGGKTLLVMNSPNSRSAAWLVGLDLDPSWHRISEWAIGPLG